MRWNAVASVVLSVVSICVQAVELSCATIMVGKGHDRPFASWVAIVLALLALSLAVIGIAQPREEQWVRVLVLCLAVGALLYSLYVV
ncbi:MAG: hypothetical protein ABSG53_00040 [Thermoguttaceae bacterium]|jgi:hypothetical protein